MVPDARPRVSRHRRSARDSVDSPGPAAETMMGTGPFGSRAHRRADVFGAVAQWKESPQAPEPPALGLSMVKPCLSMLSATSIVAPARYRALLRSTPHFTPPTSSPLTPPPARPHTNNASPH